MQGGRCRRIMRCVVRLYINEKMMIMIYWYVGGRPIDVVSHRLVYHYYLQIICILFAISDVHI
jgi:hypothetical protein